MVVTITYTPSDVEALQIVRKIKAQLGIKGKIDTPEERRKIYDYLKSRGMNMAMEGCNPDVFFMTGNRAEDKALCMLYNEMRAEGIREAEEFNEEQRKKYGSMFQSTYEANKKLYERQERDLQMVGKPENDKLEELRKNTGIKTVPKPTPVLPKNFEQMRKFWLHPAPNPTWPGFKPTVHVNNPPVKSLAPKAVHETVIPNTSTPEKKGIDVRKVGLAVAGLAVLYYLARRG